MRRGAFFPLLLAAVLLGALLAVLVASVLHALGHLAPHGESAAALDAVHADYEEEQALMQALDRQAAAAGGDG